ncbi:uncharacterized protein LOC109602679 [Aethina tumida]|uniref:uncharacterized protein LOC109602679 n=1 Tax=Aethina tumida TaxID=116153 RepID=UPI00214919A0|nr:uncharacterized protein LOC109602679 [Aethina tumida]
MMLIPILLLVVAGLAQSETLYKEVVADNSTEVQLEYVLLDGENPCKRKCIKGAAPMVCRYTFEVEWYETLTKACYDCPIVADDCFKPDCVPADGYRRPILVVNRKMPGPSIEVCEGDQVIVDVVNELTSETTTIHWHGQHQKGYPYMDGVPYVSQCPIMPGSTFRYDFKAVNPGTHFWHSHSGVQRADGAFGALIVRQPAEDDAHAGLYDNDNSLMTIIDWDAEIGMKKFVSHHHSIGDNKPSTLLINGLGLPVNSQPSVEGALNLTARFFVNQGERYRFRLINAGFLNCPIEMSIDNHTIAVISSDGSDFKPINATSLVTYAGERFDFILNADQAAGLYWIRFRGLMDCDERFTSAHQVAVLHYKEADSSESEFPEGDPSYETSHNEGVQVNALNKGTEDNITEHVPVPRFESLKPWDETLRTKPDLQFYIAYDFYRLNNPHFHKFPEYGFYNVSQPNRVLTPQINHISMKFPNFAVMPQRDQVKDSMFCNQSTVSNCVEEFCECLHVMQIPLGAVVELVLVDEGFAYNANHPLHLHGYAFRVVAMERLGENTTVAEIKDRDARGLIKRNLLDAPLKDTVTVPDGGYTIVRFVANNPGYWIFHCHIEFHVELGMALIFKVGEHDDMLPVPKNFQKCGDYMPSQNDESENNSSPSVPPKLALPFGLIYLCICLLNILFVK